MSILFLQNIEKRLTENREGLLLYLRNICQNILIFCNQSQNTSSGLKFPKVLTIKHNNQNDQILMGCIYIPPEYSKYSSEEAFTEIEEEMLTFSSNTNKIALVGDFNSRTSNLSDIVIVDDNLFNILDIVISRSGMVK